jgi:opacity protein-like surface antigen
MKSILIFLFGCTIAAAQPISLQLKAGVPMTSVLDTVSAARTTVNHLTNPYILGAGVELRLPAGFGVEFDALYRRFSYDANIFETVTNLNTSANNWQFPLLIKKRFSGGLVRPFLGAGANFNKITGVSQTVQTVAQRITLSDPDELTHDSATGFLVAGGLEINALFLKITPEVRYTRWGRDNFTGVIGPGGTISSNRNQAEFLLGIGF